MHYHHHAENLEIEENSILDQDQDFKRELQGQTA